VRADDAGTPEGVPCDRRDEGQGQGQDNGLYPEANVGHSFRGAILVACVIGTIAFSVYARTLLPGVDLGDTGGFQAAVLWPETSARQAYPLYYSLARPFVLAVSPDNPARGLNLFSALAGGVAVGLLTWFAALLTTSAAAGAVAGLLLAFSHTFWTQSVIAEVYSLHIALIAWCLLALHAYSQQPTRRRLTIFFAVYALSFGNHLSMILLLVPFALFLVLVHPRPRDLLQPATVGLAIGVACAGALLYAPNFLFVWTNIDAPPRWNDRLATFWFDVTKSDWRGTMMGGVDRSELVERVAMWIWDARLQFGLAGLALAIAGVFRLWFISRPWTLLLLSAYLVNTIFAVTYNVGDPHVFFLPGHAITALAIAALFAGWHPVKGRPADDRSSAHRAPLLGVPQYASVIAVAALIAYAGWRGWDTWPSADRSSDRRADTFVARVTAGVSDVNALLLSDMDWQLENALLYSSRYERRQLAWRRAGEVLPHLPFLVNDNHAIGRDVVLAGNAAARIVSAYGTLFPIAADAAPPRGIADRVAELPRGTPYVLTLLEPAGGDVVEADDFDRALGLLGGASARPRSAARFQVWAGTSGEPGAVYRESNRPFRSAFSILGDRFGVRIESWLPFETFRRAGFGHVLRGREPVLTIERGISLVWFESDGSPVVSYAAGLYAPKARLRIPASVPQQVARGSGAMLKKTWLTD
jgi:hypothetical protein